MRTSIIPILFSIFLIPGLASAASVDTENFTVDVTEVNGKLEFVVELRDSSSSQPATSNDTAEPDSDAELVEPPATVSISVEAPATDDIVNVVLPNLQAGSFGDVMINEFVSDPVTGEPEWVELYNSTMQPITLNDWYIIEGSGKKTVLTGVLEPMSYMIVTAPKGALNNGGDLIELYDAFDTKIDNVAYGTWVGTTAPSVSDPQSVGRDADQDDLFIAMTPSPSAINISANVVETASVDNTTLDNTTTNTNTQITDETNGQTDTVSASANEPTTCTPAPSDVAEPASASGAQFIELANIRTLPVGSQVATEGVVSAVPGSLGKQVFYLAGSGVQVYLYSADFPALPRGTRVRIEGELTESSGETRVKLSSASDIQILGTVDAPAPHDIMSDEVGEATEGWLVRMTGMVSERSSGDFYLEDANGVARVFIKDSTGIVNSTAVGDNLTVTGIVSQTSSGYRILPRDQADILPRVAEEDESDLLAVGSVGASTPGSFAGWALSSLAVAGLASAGVMHLKKKNSKWNKTPQTA